MSEKPENIFIQTLKKKWLVNGTLTILLMAIIVAVFIAINIITHKQNWNPIDFSQDKLYSLTEESKEKLRSVDKEVNIYFVGYSVGDPTIDLAKQYTNANENIKVELIDENTRPDLMKEYEIESGSQGIILECDNKKKALSPNDLQTFDSQTYEYVDIAEQKLTLSILTIASNDIPKVYFLEGYSDFKLSSGMNYLSIYLSNEVNETAVLDLLSKEKVPDDCDTLVIPTPNKDFDEIATNAIIDYINSGRNILWLNAAITTDENMPNVNKILALYGVLPFEKGLILESDSDKMISSPNVIIPTVSQTSKITKDIYKSTGIVFLNATKINLKEVEELDELKVVKDDLLYTGENAFFREDFSIQSTKPVNGETQEKMLVGAELQKIITDANEETGEKAVTSKLVIIGENYFASDIQLNANYQAALVQLASNKDLVLNSISYLVDREEDITVRKDTGATTYTATQQQHTIIMFIIIIVPITIIISGIVVWVKRKRRE